MLYIKKGRLTPHTSSCVSTPEQKTWESRTVLPVRRPLFRVSLGNLDSGSQPDVMGDCKNKYVVTVKRSEVLVFTLVSLWEQKSVTGAGRSTASSQGGYQTAVTNLAPHHPTSCSRFTAARRLINHNLLMFHYRCLKSRPVSRIGPLQGAAAGQMTPFLSPHATTRPVLSRSKC